MSQNTISQRIAEMVKLYTKGNKSAFAKAVGISNQSLGEIVGPRQSAPSFAALQKIALAYPSTSIHWLVLGEGEMLEITNQGTAQKLEEYADEVEAEVARQLIKGEVSASMTQTSDNNLWQLRQAEEEIRIKLIQHIDQELNTRKTKYMQKLAGQTDFAHFDNLLSQIEEERESKETNYVEAVRRRIRAERALLGFNTSSLTAIYKLGDEPEEGILYGGLLSKRLNISSEAAEKLVTGDKIHATNIDGEGYRISEHFVRLFLGEFF